MSLQSVLDYLKEAKEYRFFRKQVGSSKNTHVYGITGSQKSVMTALLLSGEECPLLYIVESAARSKEVFDDLCNLLPVQCVQFFPSLDALPFEVLAQSHETRRKRLEVLEGLLTGSTKVVITTLEALSKTLMPAEVFQKALISFKIGQSTNLPNLLAFLVKGGYQRVERVEGKGQFSQRGGILDLFPPTAENPIRVEFFDEEIESIRLFSVESQRSLQKVSEFALMPAVEFFLTGLDREKALGKIREEGNEFLRKLGKRGHREAYNNVAKKLELVKEFIVNEHYYPGYEQLLPYFVEKKHTLFDYFLKPPLVIFDEPSRQEESSLAREKEISETFLVLGEKGKVLPGQINNYLNWEEWSQLLKQRETVSFSLFPQKSFCEETVNLVGVSAKTINLFMGKTRLLAEELKELKGQEYAVVILVDSQERAQRLRQGLWDLGLEVSWVDRDIVLQKGKVYLTKGYLTAGFVLTSWKLAVLTEHELFCQPKKRTQRRMFQEGKRVAVLEDLQMGDYVVHVSHGIGRYLGIEKLAVGDTERDYLVIKYRGEDKLYVPTAQVGLLQKYSYQEGLRPKLSKLGGSEWSKVKSKVKGSVKDLAQELLSLYAARYSSSGYAFASDTPWQKEFEDAFPFEETEDQLKCSEEVKKDMEKPQPMDRLLCGDVGYGKTEVAIRAACKVALDGKQTAFLVPTTILAQQHYNTLCERFAGFPIKVSVLSRFCSPKEQKQTLQALRQGIIDIVIGTHRLLSSDIEFKDLGLLVVDEEQRFGVIHKEKLKKLKKSVDVLTLTATPIPRTLQMSLVGVRDMSTIETPPENRYPVQTFVVEYSPQLIYEAIKREIDRGGQVYFVHNRVEDIEKVALEVQALIPTARVGIAHGQMTEYQLENVMLGFLEGHLDVLVCTTIIESGLDISNVNTLLVDQADKLGLAQLYQLRGRVGRSNRVAYAYLMYKKDKVLSEIAERRLSAIREFTELGSGFKIAMRDLEIRGAGNILGAEQSGQIAAVGFDLYCQMLEEAVKEAKGEALPEEKTVLIDIYVKAFIPEEYIADNSIKIDFYQRIHAVKEQTEIKQLADELKDRFGSLPEPVVNLLQIASIKLLAASSKIVSITQKKEEIKILMSEDHSLTGEKLMDLARCYRRKVSFSVSAGLEVIVNIGDLEQSQRLSFLEKIVTEISMLALEEKILI